ncbi:AATF-like protein [Drosera capensis]
MGPSSKRQKPVHQMDIETGEGDEFLSESDNELSMMHEVGGKDGISDDHPTTSDDNDDEDDEEEFEGDDDEDDQEELEDDDGKVDQEELEDDGGEEGLGEYGEGSDYGGERTAGQLDAEMEELEKEYWELKNSEENLVSNLKRHKEEDILKGQAVKNQKFVWDKELEFRFLLQKEFSNSNRLPPEPFRSSFFGVDEEVETAYTDTIDACKTTITSLLELQEALLEKNSSITQGVEGESGLFSNDSRTSNSSDDESDEWSKISSMQSRVDPFRNKSIDKWQRKSEVNTGAAVKRSKLLAFNQNISDQVATYMRDPSKMIRGMQMMEGTVHVLGAVNEPGSNTKEEEAKADGDPQLLNDIVFYQQLLKEFFETIDPSASEAAFYALKRVQTKKRKAVDRRASKSRKIRYNVHEKLVNFMAPQPMNLPPMASKLFANLFGLKSQKSAV